MPVDETNSEIIKARKKVQGAWEGLLQAQNELQELIGNHTYNDAFNDGVAWLRAEFKRVSGSADIEPEETATAAMSKVDQLAYDGILATITKSPGLRTSDIAQIVGKPLKPAITEDRVRSLINRIKDEGKIENKSGRWYTTNAQTRGPDYQVMTYMSDGSKYLGSDISR